MTDRYRKKPVEVRAWKISLDGQEPDWVRESFDGGRIDWCPAGEGIYINTLEGRMKANIGDMLIEGVKGELYGCRADIFAATYEPVETTLAAHPAITHCDRRRRTHMTAEIELLPLPEGYDKYNPPRLYDGQMFHEGQMRAYARANSARAIAPLQAEIEALRETLATLEAENERLRAEVERLRSMTAVTMGVGSGDGNLFVHGDWESIKAAQAIVLEQGALRAEVERLRRKAHPAITHCDNCGCDWLDNGLNPVGCPYCKAETEASRRTLTKERAYKMADDDCAALAQEQENKA